MAITITDWTHAYQEEAPRLLARAFVTNPLNVAVFGRDQVDSNERFFRIGLTFMNGRKLAAIDGGRLVGMIHWVDSSGCQMALPDKLRILPSMINSIGPRRALRVVGWRSVWERNDPSEHHLHLGPICVSPEVQGRQIGRRMMDRYCEELDRTESIGYLETDRPENVAFYEKFGFIVSGTASVLDVPNTFMRRSASRV